MSQNDIQVKALSYNERFYEVVRDGSLISARYIIPIIMEFMPFSVSKMSVVDVGCGVGAWLSVFIENGCTDITGIDSGDLGETNLLIPVENYIHHDLSTPFPMTRRFDVCFSLEVAEHIDEVNARLFVETLTVLSDIVVFSAAIPNQGGVGHVNCQWPTYWINLFANFDFKPIDCLRSRIWTNPDIAWWYSQNIFIFCKNTKRNKKLLKLNSHSNMVDLVHPKFNTPYHTLEIEELAKETKVLAPHLIVHDDFSKLPPQPATISFVVVTSARRLTHLIDLLKSLILLKDELVVILDNSDVLIKAQLSEYADKVVQILGKGSFEAYAGDIFSHCTKDWIFRIDDDETLSENCSKELIQDCISNRNVSSYWIGRKWFINENEYICTSPWLPDYQLRLFRNLPSIMTLPQHIHNVLGVGGNTEILTEIYLLHWDLALNPYEDRKAKVGYYEELFPGNPCDVYYLYEDNPYGLFCNNDATKFTGGEGILGFCKIPRILKLELEYIVEISMSISDEHVAEIIQNHEKVNISYHWYNEDKTVYGWDYNREQIPRPKNSSFNVFMPITLPKNSGQYYFQIDIVEEGVQWLSDTGLLKSELLKVVVEKFTKCSLDAKK